MIWRCSIAHTFRLDFAPGLWTLVAYTLGGRCLCAPRLQVIVISHSPRGNTSQLSYCWLCSGLPKTQTHSGNGSDQLDLMCSQLTDVIIAKQNIAMLTTQ